MIPEAASYVYDEGLRKRKTPAAETLKNLLSQLFAQVDDMRLVVDGLDEVAESEHKTLVKGLLYLVESQSSTRLLLVSQDLPSISRQLVKRPSFSMNSETIRENVGKDIDLIVQSSLFEILSDMTEDDIVVIRDEERQALATTISDKAKGETVMRDSHRIAVFETHSSKVCIYGCGWCSGCCSRQLAWATCSNKSSGCLKT